MKPFLDQIHKRSERATVQCYCNATSRGRSTPVQNDDSLAWKTIPTEGLMDQLRCDDVQDTLHTISNLRQTYTAGLVSSIPQPSQINFASAAQKFPGTSTLRVSATPSVVTVRRVRCFTVGGPPTSSQFTLLAPGTLAIPNRRIIILKSANRPLFNAASRSSLQTTLWPALPWLEQAHHALSSMQHQGQPSSSRPMLTTALKIVGGASVFIPAAARSCGEFAMARGTLMVHLSPRGWRLAGRGIGTLALALEIGAWLAFGLGCVVICDRGSLRSETNRVYPSASLATQYRRSLLRKWQPRAARAPGALPEPREARRKGQQAGGCPIRDGGRIYALVLDMMRRTSDGKKGDPVPLSLSEAIIKLLELEIERSAGQAYGEPRACVARAPFHEGHAAVRSDAASAAAFRPKASWDKDIITRIQFKRKSAVQRLPITQGGDDVLRDGPCIASSELRTSGLSLFQK
ncbi:hypothetical protein F5148DRAFT_1148064 [Russula earlei]|uniref:Uncharacterized protein n=1 Tax=Russula earlei TaxID=71964 RepID=A0ACC0UFB4_9AGAM|nr:hypothetical protein F5148DRAFT_1148064 [Russula earlei]